MIIVIVIFVQTFVEDRASNQLPGESVMLEWFPGRYCVPPSLLPSASRGNKEHQSYDSRGRQFFRASASQGQEFVGKVSDNRSGSECRQSVW